MPVLGVIFLRHTANRFDEEAQQIADAQAAGRMPKPKVLEDLMRPFNSEPIKRATGDVFGRIYAYSLAKFSIQKAHDNGRFFTPSSLVQTIVNVIEPDHGIVFDPAIGSADMAVHGLEGKIAEAIPPRPLGEGAGSFTGAGLTRTRSSRWTISIGRTVRATTRPWTRCDRRAAT
jgi:hypothetical protein